jgi:hypothetical protein
MTRKNQAFSAKPGYPKGPKDGFAGCLDFSGKPRNALRTAQFCVFKA